MTSRRRLLASGVALAGLAACQSRGSTLAVLDHIEVRDPRMAEMIDLDAPLETLGTGYGWSEGPTWDRDRMRLYFTDVPGNTAYQWQMNAPVDVFLQPSGTASAEGFREPGANGLWYGRDGRLIVCNHGMRRVERLDLTTNQRIPLAETYDGKRFNSPNDVVEARDTTLYFTDPPYGLEGLDASPLKEMSVNGVYRQRPGSPVELLVSDMTFPNGVALSPDESRLYVSQSDPAAPLIRELTLNAAGAVTHERVVFDASSLMAEDAPGLPDGMAVCAEGYLFATGPGGVLVISPEGDLLGRILTGRATANCAFGEDGRTLFITAHDRLMRIRTRMLGVQWT